MSGDSAATATPKATATHRTTPTSTKPPARKVTVPDELPPDELQIKDIVKGKGPAAKNGDKVSMQYTGLTWSTSARFDTSWDDGSPTR